LFPVWHVGTDYLHEIGKNWYDYLVSKGVQFKWEEKVTNISFEAQQLWTDKSTDDNDWIGYDRLIFAVGKSGIDFGKQLADEYILPTEPKPVQIGVRFEAPQKHFQKLIDISYDFKLYRKFEDEGVSLRSFCTNNNAAYVAVEHTYGDVSYNGHAKKGEEHRNDMTNFGILMEIQGIEEPFKWSRELVEKVNKTWIKDQGIEGRNAPKIHSGLYYSPSRKVGVTSEGEMIDAMPINDDQLDEVREAFGGYFDYIEEFIDDMQIVFPTLEEDWGIYIPEVKVSVT
jgi:uncharacterized FAD-dependent dehydrogenase